MPSDTTEEGPLAASNMKALSDNALVARLPEMNFKDMREQLELRGINLKGDKARLQRKLLNSLTDAETRRWSSNLNKKLVVRELELRKANVSGTQHACTARSHCAAPAAIHATIISMHTRHSSHARSDCCMRTHTCACIRTHMHASEPRPFQMLTCTCTF